MPPLEPRPIATVRRGGGRRARRAWWLAWAPWLGACGGSPAGHVAVTVVTIPSASPVAEADPAELRAAETRERSRLVSGAWEGHGEQDDGQTWPIRVEVLAAGLDPCATVEYPPHDAWDISCRGEWRCEPSRTTPVHLVATERILEGDRRCIDACRIDADLERGVVSFDCPHAGVRARAVIQRRPPAAPQ